MTDILTSRGACSFTGHRQIKARHRERIGELLARAIEYAYSEGCRDFYAGGAIGFDTVAAREVVRFKLYHPDVCLFLLLPCRNQDGKWSDSQRSSYEFLLSVADEIFYTSDEYTPDCMRLRNRSLAERCDILIAYVGRDRSGASQTARMAEKLGKRIYNLYPALENNG